MVTTRHGGSLPRALASQVHPVFMTPALAASAFGGVLAGSLQPMPAVLHLAAVFSALYTAHVKDGYVDFYRRGEDEAHPLTARGCRLVLVGSSLAFLSAAIAVWTVVDSWAALLTLPGWFIGYLHAPQLDRHPVGATLGYPAGIGLALLGGYYVQAGGLGARPVAFAAAFVVVLSGVKVIDDAKDYAYDRSISKRTVAVVLGPAGARRLANASMGLGLGLMLAFAAVGLFPRGTVLGIAAFTGVGLLARGLEPAAATRVLIRGAIGLLAFLLLLVWLDPLGRPP